MPALSFSCGREPTPLELPSGHRPATNGKREDRRSGAACAAAPCRRNAGGTALSA
ncbi:MAG: hypothetical protein INF92_08000 [Rhodobacter sp.]|nr:hypothetical protein [Rhodobacter sp.]